jgi:hypothetical protein
LRQSEGRVNEPALSFFQCATIQPKINTHGVWNESSRRDLELFMPGKNLQRRFYESNHCIRVISIVACLGSDGLHNGL